MKNNVIKICKNVETHFLRYKSFYISLMISLIIIFIWCKWGRKILEKINSNNKLNQLNLSSENDVYNDKIVNEITDILGKIN